MDIATLLGIIFGLVIIGAAIFIGGSAGTFVNVPSLLIVVGGTICATLVKFPLPAVGKYLKSGVGAAFKNDKTDPVYIYEQALEMGGIVRKNGLLGLETVTVDNELFQRGIRLCTDGHALEVVRDTLSREINTSILDDEAGEAMFRGIGDSAPAFGMIGTLVGLVQMLSNLDDPASIGPAMAVAMLTTFYGAVIANLIALPMADKLAFKAERTRVTKDLILESVTQIHGSQNPSVMSEILSAFLPVNQRPAPDDGAGE
ncbi:MAG: MotA/TolQ/ExbB proton channel family protein [Magnetovibrionaceae bacterium]